METMIPKDKQIYLVIADETEEFENALRYASRSAKSSSAHVAILYIIGEQGFMFWGGVEERVKEEQREEAQKFLSGIAAKVNKIDGLQPILLIGEGDRIEAILKIIGETPGICRLILGGNTKAKSPGPLVSYFSGKGIGRLPVPLTIVPDHIQPETLDGFI